MDDKIGVAGQAVQGASVGEIAQDDLNLQVAPERVNDISSCENSNRPPASGELADEVATEEAGGSRHRHQAGGHD